MKKIIALLLTLSSFNVFAKNFYDYRITNCKNGNYEVLIEGKNSLFGSRNIVVKKAGQVIIDEEYEEAHFPFSDRGGPSILGQTEYTEILKFGYKLKPKSFNSDMDHEFRVSNNTIVMQTYSALQPAFGGDTPALILQLVPYKTIIPFELNTQCNITKL